MFDVISIGDTTIDVFLEIDEKEVRVEDENHDGIDDLIMDFGTKLPVSKLTRLAAVGNAANNAIGSSRLGLSTAIYTVLGDKSDLDSNEHVEVFEKEGVKLGLISREEGAKSNFSVVINVGAERTILVYHVDRHYKLPEGMEGKWLYYTSLGKGHEGLNQEIVEYVEKTGARLCYQPGSHQLRTGLEQVRPLIERSTFLVMNKEEAQALQGSRDECPELVRGFRQMGAKIVAVTDGEKGSFASDGEDIWFQDIYDVEVIERTGCGDSYSTAFMAALVQELPITEAMRWGSVNAASVLGYVGAREGLLTSGQIHEWLEKKPEFGPRKV